MDMDERWVNRSPETMLETFHWFRGEGFDLIVEDLLRLPPEPGVIVEGFRLLPHLVQPLLAEPRTAVGSSRHPSSTRAASTSRGFVRVGLPRPPSKPARARRNLLGRRPPVHRPPQRRSPRLGLPAIEVDTTMTEDELTDRVTKSLGL